MLLSRQSGRELQARQIYGQLADEFSKSDWAPRALVARGALEERMRERVIDKVLGTAVSLSLVTYRTLSERYPAYPRMRCGR